MPFDAYSTCPGGTGKKIKFCCSDLVGELEKIDRMIEGEQFVACRDVVTKLDEKHPGRPCLLSWKLLLEQMTGDHEAATRTLTGFIANHPNNPIALAETALQRAQEGDIHVAIGFMQSAIEASGEQLSERVYAAIGALGEMLLMAQQIFPAFAHLTLQVTLSGGQDQRPLELLMRMENSPSVPMLLKGRLEYVEPSAQASWHGAFEEIVGLAVRGSWRAAKSRLEKLVDQAADDPALWHNLATLRGKLGDYAGCVEALRRYASLAGRGVSLAGAVEAEALAQSLDRDNAEGTVDSLLVTLGIHDIDELERRLASDRQADRMDVDPRALAEEESPPPRAVYWLLDRPVVSSGPDLPADQIPQILGHVLIFGKQTDREARLELDVQRTLFPQALEILKRVAGDSLGDVQSEEVTGHVSTAQLAMSWQWRLPSDMTAAHRSKLLAEQRRVLLLERWPNLPLPLLAGRTPAEAAGDPAYHVPLLAAILVLELSETEPSNWGSYDELRRQLNLPVPPPVDSAAVDVQNISLVQLTRVAFDKLPDVQLKQAFSRLVGAGFAPAIHAASLELTRRESPELVDYRLAAYRNLARDEQDPEKAMQLIATGRELSNQARRSCALWDLEELNLRIEQQDGKRVAELIVHLRDQHGREPGVAEALASVFMRLGMIGPDGRVRMPAAAAQEAPGIVVPGAEAAAGKLWTPDSGTPAATKSGLWVPE
jgi:hypothetical protein